VSDRGDSRHQRLTDPSTRGPSRGNPRQHRKPSDHNDDGYHERPDMEAATTEDEDDDNPDDGADPGRSGKAGEQTEEEHDDKVRRQDSGGHRSPADQLGERDWKQHGEEDAQKVRVGEGDVRSDDVVSGCKVAAAEKP